MDDQDLVFLARQLLHRGAPARRIEQVAHDHREARMRKQGGEPVYGGLEIGGTGAGKPVEETEQPQNLRASTAQLERRLQRGRKRRAADAVEILEPDVAQGRRDLFRVVDLRRLAFSRGGRKAIDALVSTRR